MTLAIETTNKINRNLFKVIGGVLVSITYFYFLLSFPTKAQAPILNVLPPTQSFSAKKSFTNLVRAQYSKPITVQIPSIGVNSKIESVKIGLIELLCVFRLSFCSK